MIKLLPKTRDERDFSVGAVFELPKLEELPTSFTIGLPTVVNQTSPLNPDTDFCASTASCAVSELQEGVQLGYEWVFAVAKWLQGGDPDAFGLELRDICKAHVKYGAIEREDSPMTMETNSMRYMRRLENWPEDLFEKAEKHKKGSYFSVTGNYDSYDNIRATMWKFRDERCGILFGVIWGWSLSQVEIKDFVDRGYGHALAGIGWNEKGLFVQNSMGKEAGENGRHYFSREVINHFVDVYGAYMFHDMPKEQAQYYVDSGEKYQENVIIRILKFIRNLFIR